MATRYVLERVAKQPNSRRIKDTAKSRYVKQPHGQDVWPEQVARVKARELNDALAAAEAP